MFSAILAISSCEMFPIIVFEMPLCSQLKIYILYRRSFLRSFPKLRLRLQLLRSHKLYAHCQTRTVAPAV